MESNIQKKIIYSYFYSKKHNPRKYFDEFNDFKYWINNNLIHLLNLYKILLQITDKILVSYIKVEIDKKSQRDINNILTSNQLSPYSQQIYNEDIQNTSTHQQKSINKNKIIVKKLTIDNTQISEDINLLDIICSDFIRFSYHVFTYNFTKNISTYHHKQQIGDSVRSKELLNTLNNTLDEFTIEGH